MKNERRLRRLVVGDAIWYWTVRQRVRHTYDDCRLTLSLYPEGTRRRLALIFRPHQERIISNTYFDSGALLRLPDRTYVNLHEPGTVRRLLDAAMPILDLRPSEQVIEVDGWQYFDAITDDANDGPRKPLLHAAAAPAARIDSPHPLESDFAMRWHRGC